jgi:uncharacterized protein YihD (DUF1040 family)
MSEDSLNKLNEVIDLIQKYGKTGAKLFFLFKLLKIRVEEEVRRRYPNAIIDEKILNKLCMQIAQELVNIGKDKLTEDDIKKLLSKQNAQK